MNKIDISFASKALIKGGIYLYLKHDALQYVFACQKEDIPILGIDAFYITQKSTQPSMEHSIDFSTHLIDKSTFAEATKFLEGMPDSLYFEIVTAD
jgi:hypothetical protein